MPDVASIRPFDLGQDLDAALTIWSAAAAAAHPFIEGEGTGERLAKVRDIYFPMAESYVVEDEDTKLTGFVSLIPGPGNTTEIGGLFVDPARQGSGFGQALVGYCARAKGTLTLEVFEKNETARRFYDRAGFIEESRRRDPETGHVLIRKTRLARN